MRVPDSGWVIKPGAFELVVDPHVFREAQRVLAQRTCAKSNKRILDDLRTLFVQNGKLTSAILNNTPGAPSVSALKKRFGGMRRAFELAGYFIPTRYSRGHKASV